MRLPPNGRSHGAPPLPFGAHHSLSCPDKGGAPWNHEKGPRFRHARAGGHPGFFNVLWIPAFAGMTEEMLCPLVYADQVLLKGVIGQPLLPPLQRGKL